MLSGWREKSHQTNISDINYFTRVSDWPIKFLNCWWHSGCFQFRGQLTITVLCFRPPSPPTWIRWDVPSLRLEEMTTWEKPFTFSVSINLRRDYKYTERWRVCEELCWELSRGGTKSLFGMSEVSLRSRSRPKLWVSGQTSQNALST